MKKQVIRSILVLGLTFLISQQAQAFLITDYILPSPVLDSTSAFQDTQTGRVWLDVSVGYFLNYNEIQSGLLNTGFVTAKKADLDQLGSSIFSSGPIEIEQMYVLGYPEYLNFIGMYGDVADNRVSTAGFTYGSTSFDSAGSFRSDTSDQAIGVWAYQDSSLAGGSTVPEPATLSLMGMGMAGLLFRRRLV